MDRQPGHGFPTTLGDSTLDTFGPMVDLELQGGRLHCGVPLATTALMEFAALARTWVSSSSSSELPIVPFVGANSEARSESMAPVMVVLAAWSASPLKPAQEHRHLFTELVFVRSNMTSLRR